jgi:Domain of unknown function (DUF6250)
MGALRWYSRFTMELVKRNLGRVVCAVMLVTLARAGWSQAATSQPVADKRFHAGNVLYTDDFTHGLDQWRVEMEGGANVPRGTLTAKDGVLDIDVPAGVTVWFRQELEGPVMIQYETTVISAGGANDRVSDLNSFWMATDPKSPQDIFVHPRTGRFAEYNSLQMYYVGVGGNGNTTTRFRRYIGDAVKRPLLPENDLSVAQHPEKGIVANQRQIVTLIAVGGLIQYWRDGEKIFEMNDPQPYTKGWFGIRTTKNQMQVKNLRITRLLAN